MNFCILYLYIFPLRLKKEQEEKEHKKKEKAEAHLYTIIKVARDEDLLVQIGKDIYFDSVDHDKVRSFRIQKQLPFTAFKVGTLREVSNKAHNAELKLFLEVERGVDFSLLPLPDKSREDILIYFKLYDPEKEELRYVGRMFLKAVGKPIEILAKLNELAGFPDNEEIDLYEEIKFEPNIMCEPIDKRISFKNSQLEDGDIICIQKAIVPESETNYRYPDVPSFLEYVHNRQVVLSVQGEIVGFQPTNRVAVSIWASHPLAKELYKGCKLTPGMLEPNLKIPCPEKVVLIELLMSTNPDSFVLARPIREHGELVLAKG
ncbi:ubiquitin carboxyl-terminal hydrolase 12-like protein [Carex littledalei]|uniref:Ubiquitin carboxyl-terminal hydrolase 12-like protein n=1 Tax=Carex littledalei TaxID=544730 RepID=A0A833RKM9_9POAL|nr:ubiquitin carboxyl-terminal hydrolase 12-like protein [Carex littledalei]